MNRGLLLALALLSSPAGADNYASALIADIQTGIVCAPEVMGTVPAPDTVAGVTNIVDAMPPFVSDSHIVPAVIGIGFAVASTAAGADLADVMIEVTHPPMGDAGVTTQRFPSGISASGGSFTIYQFEYEYELVEGPWTVAAWQGNTRIWQADFTIVPPELVPDLAAPCGYTNLLS